MVIACEHFGVEGGARVRCNCLNQWAQTIVFISKVCSVYKNIGIGCRWTTWMFVLFRHKKQTNGGYYAIKAGGWNCARDFLYIRIYKLLYTGPLLFVPACQCE